MRNVLRALVVAGVAWTLFVALLGGFDLRPFDIPFKSTEADRPGYATLLFIVLYAALYRRGLGDDVRWLESRADPVARFVERWSASIALAAAAVAFGLGMTYGIHVAGGSDSYGYVSQSRLWLERDLIVEQPIARAVPWPDADWTFAPLGYRPAQGGGAIVPVYGPGLPVLMALGQLAIGQCGAYVVVPLLAAWLVWLTYRLGEAVASPITGVTSALLMSTSPVFLFMTLNPMSDVPVSAFLTAGLVLALSSSRRRALWTAVAVSLGIFVRPNLVPIGAIYLIVLLLRAPAGERWRTVWQFAAGGAIPVLAVALTNAALYGAPWYAGYGSLSEMYSASFFTLNVRRYLTWLLQKETPLVFLAPVAIVLCWRTANDRRRLAYRVLGAFIAAVWLVYLFYLPFDTWSYLRFMLPAFPAMMVLAVVAAAFILVRFVGGTPPRGSRSAAAVGLLLIVAIFAFRIERLRHDQILGARVSGVVLLSAADYVRTKLPPNAVVLTIQHSGSVRHYTNRLTMRWDLLAPEWWPRALDLLVARGYRPYLLVASFEEPQLRRHLSLTEAADAPGTLVAEMTTPEAVRLYDPLRATTGPAETIPRVDVCPCGLDAPERPVEYR